MCYPKFLKVWSSLECPLLIYMQEDQLVCVFSFKNLAPLGASNYVFKALKGDQKTYLMIPCMQPSSCAQ
jgi:hypothetical protein